MSTFVSPLGAIHIKQIVFIAFVSLGWLSLSDNAAAENIPKSVKPPADHILLTVFFKHDQSKKLGQIQEELAASKFWTRFPPKGVGVHSWYVVMGIGMVVTLKVPPEKLREVNRTIEQTAWGTFRTEFFATYDFWPVVQRIKEKAASSSK